MKTWDLPHPDFLSAARRARDLIHRDVCLPARRCAPECVALKSQLDFADLVELVISIPPSRNMRMRDPFFAVEEWP